MTNRFPLILDEATGRLKELPVGDFLDLTGSGIIAAASLEVNGEANVDKLTIGTQTINPSGTAGASNNAPLATVAFTGDFNDLANLPNSGFSGSYNDLSDTPVIPSTTKDLNDVSLTNPANNQALVWNSVANEYQPRDIVLNLDLSTTSIRDLFDVSYTLAPDTNSVLKYFADAWRPSKIQYTEIQNRPTALSAFANDLNYVTQQDLESGIEITPTGDLTGSVFSDDSTLLVDGVNSLINLNETIDDNVVPKDANTVDLGSPSKPFNNIYLSASGIFSGDYTELLNLPTSITDFGVSDGTAGQVLTTDGSGNFAFQDAGDQIGNFTLSASTIDTDDSSAITITPAVVMSSDLTVENDVLVNGSVTASSFISTGDGDPEFSSQTDITLSATTRVTISSSPLKLATFTTIERDALTSEFGDMVYNSDVRKMQGYVEDSGSGTPGWVDLH